MVSATPHVLHANGAHQARQVAHALGRNVALVRAADGTAHGPAHVDAGCARRVHHRGKALNALGNAAVDVLLAEGFAGGGEDHDFIRLRLERRLKTLQVGREHRVAHAGQAREARHHFHVVGHLRHPLGRHKAGDFNFFQASGLEPLHQLNLDGGRHGLLLVLQAITRPDFD